MACETCGKVGSANDWRRTGHCGGGCGTVCALPKEMCSFGGAGFEPCSGCDDEELSHPGHLRRVGACRTPNHFKHARPVFVPETEALSVRGKWTPLPATLTKKKMAAFLALMSEKAAA